MIGIIAVIVIIFVIILMVSNSSTEQKYSNYVPPAKEDYRYVETKIPNAERTKEGWVYIISNLGSFGKGIYKVGMTRRDNPQDRTDELGDASVPFPFDVHAYVWAEDAPALESEIQNVLSEHRYNKVNKRKEFFQVDLETIRDLVIEAGFPVEEFNMDHPAEQYYESNPIVEPINAIKYDSKTT